MTFKNNEGQYATVSWLEEEINNFSYLIGSKDQEALSSLGFLAKEKICESVNDLIISIEDENDNDYALNNQEHLAVLVEFLLGNNTGNSSKSICAVLAGVEQKQVNYPYDPSDFKRCHTLFEKLGFVHKMRALALLSEKSKVWKVYAEHWKTLENLYQRDKDTGESEDLLNKMRELRNSAESETAR